jgi:signal transduction histidine kinase
MAQDSTATRVDGVATGPRSARYVAAMERLIDVVQELSAARELTSIVAVVRKAARELTDADGATFVLREGDKCYYAEENAISPLWKGQRFPLKNCISGWVMQNAKPAVIEDIYKDPRVPADAYRATFVKSLAMVPIRARDPVGAIGNYWAKNRMPTEEELAILQALAHVTSVAMENVDLYARLQDKVRALERSNYELANFAWAASHDLKSPLRNVINLSGWILEDLNVKDLDAAREHLRVLQIRVRRMDKMLGDVLEYAQVEHKLNDGREEMADGRILSDDVRTATAPPLGFTLDFTPDFEKIVAPRTALSRILCNLVGNAINHHDRADGRIEVDAEDEGERYTISVRDDGPGIPREDQARIFDMFQTLKPRGNTNNSGMGLALVRKILALYGDDNKITVESGPGRGAVFRFTWSRTQKPPRRTE